MYSSIQSNGYSRNITKINKNTQYVYKCVSEIKPAYPSYLPASTPPSSH